MISTLEFSRNLPKQILAALIGGLLLFFAITITWTLGYQLLFAGRIFPGVSVAGVDVSGLAPDDAALKLSQTLSFPNTGKILFRAVGDFGRQASTRMILRALRAIFLKS